MDDETSGGIEQDAQDDILRTMAQWLRSWRLAPIAAAWVEAHRPLAFVAAQLVHVIAPLVAPWDEEQRAARLASLLDDDQQGMGADRLLAVIEGKAIQP